MWCFQIFFLYILYFYIDTDSPRCFITLMNYKISKSFNEIVLVKKSQNITEFTNVI